MKKTTLPWNLGQLSTMSKKGTLSFEYPIQRKGGQWDALQKSLLIHSIVADYPVPPVLALKLENDKTTYVLDGKQRITNIIEYLTDENAKLHDETPSVYLDDIEEEFQIAGLTFEELPEAVKQKLTSSTLSISRLEDATDEEIEELFYRWNNGTPLTKQQKSRAKMGVSNATVIDSLVKHPFITEKAKFTPLQRRRSDDEAVILQSMMLFSFSDEDFTSFVADNILKFATEMRDNDTVKSAEDVKQALDYLDDAFAESSPLFKKLNLPTLIVVAKKASDENVDVDLFTSWVEDFNMATNLKTKSKALVPTKYKDFTGAGSVKKDRVLGRKATMLAHFDKFVEKAQKDVSELVEEKV